MRRLAAGSGEVGIDHDLLAADDEDLDYVPYLEQKAGKQSPTDSERRKSLASALEKAVAVNPYAKVDPVAWVHEQRDERALPGRD